MPIPSFELTRLDSATFEHLVNVLALKVLGAGHTGFGPGSDGGRDGFFEGTAPYPSATEQWGGRWYIQSKFHAPHLSKDPQKWLVDQIKSEIKEFEKGGSLRKWPDNWIIATNIDPSGTPQTGSFDKARAAVKNVRPKLAKRFHIWGGQKILTFLSLHSDISSYYSEFITPGHVISELYDRFRDNSAHIATIIRYLVVTQFSDQQYSKLEQAGAATDNRPGIHRLFTDIPFSSPSHGTRGMAAVTLAHALAQTHGREMGIPDTTDWKAWQRDPVRARSWIIKGGPGQGKSTLVQFACQVQRAALILAPNAPVVTPQQRATSQEVSDVAARFGVWPIAPRVPVVIELKNYAHWYGNQENGSSRRLLSFLSSQLTEGIGEEVKVGTLRRAFSESRWLFVFDGLDEVPGDVKDNVANEVIHFIDDVLVGCQTDASIICTSRPQGYSGQFEGIEAAAVDLDKLSPEQALACAKPLLEIDRSPEDGRVYMQTLTAALKSAAIAEIMTTPLQAHIMAVIVRDGGRPPERKWQLFNTFYQVIKKREANRNLPDRGVAKILREGDRLIKALHNRLGFELHSRAETSAGAVTSLDRGELEIVVRDVVSQLQDEDIDETVAILMRATTDRLVLVSTPEAGTHVRFDIRPLQEFFAAEYIYESGESGGFSDRVKTIAGDSHWREVMHFLISALIESTRKTELHAVISVLSDLDNGGDLMDRPLSRRLARGAIMVARLLQEGVLEQDKRLRSQFRGCLTTLMGCIDADQYLSNVQPMHSRSWLIDVLIECLRENAQSETIGALVALPHLLPDGDTRSAQVSDFLLAAPPAYRSVFFERLVKDRYPGIGRFVPQWVTDLTVAALLRDDWFRLGEMGINAATTLISGSSNRLPISLKKSGVSPSIAKVIVSVFSENPPRTQKVMREVYGGIEKVMYPPPKALDTSGWRTKTWTEFARMSGIARAIYSILAFVKDPTTEAAEFLFESVGRDVANIRLLPSPISSFIAPVGPNFAEIARKSPQSLLAKDRPGYVNQYGIFGLNKGNHDWKPIVAEFPLLGVHMLTECESSEIDANEIGCLFNTMDDQVILGCGRALLHTPLYWGFFNVLPEKSGRLFRKGILACANGPVVRRTYGRKIHSFELNLPDEAPLIPHLLNALTHFSPARFHASGTSRLRAPIDSASLRSTLGKHVSEYVPDVDKLFSLARDAKVAARDRAAAALLYHLHPSNAQGDDLFDEDWTQMYVEGESHWFLPALGVLMTDAIKGLQPKACATFGHLVNRAADDFVGRLALNEVLGKWREIASAPVQTCSNPHLWT